MAQTFLGPRIMGTVESRSPRSVRFWPKPLDRSSPKWTGPHQFMAAAREGFPETSPHSGHAGIPIPKRGRSIPITMLQSFRLERYRSLRDIWRMVLPPVTLMELGRMSLQDGGDGAIRRFALWARVVYDFALAWRMRIIDRDHLLKALTPLYLGWVASHGLRGTRRRFEADARLRIEGLCLAFEMQKSYFISRWRWPDRFNP